MSNISSIYNNYPFSQNKRKTTHCAWFYLKKEAVCFRNIAFCFEYLVKMENVLVNAADSAHLKCGLMSIALRKANALSQNVT
jgi:hypothetical protein